MPHGSLWRRVRLDGEDAQSTVEFAAVLVGLLSVVLALGALWRAGEEGALVDAAERCASHALDADGAIDISLY